MSGRSLISSLFFYSICDMRVLQFTISHPAFFIHAHHHIQFHRFHFFCIVLFGNDDTKYMLGLMFSIAFSQGLSWIVWHQSSSLLRSFEFVLECFLSNYVYVRFCLDLELQKMHWLSAPFMPFNSRRTIKRRQNGKNILNAVNAQPEALEMNTNAHHSSVWCVWCDVMPKRVSAY